MHDPDLLVEPPKERLGLLLDRRLQSVLHNQADILALVLLGDRYVAATFLQVNHLLRSELLGFERKVQLYNVRVGKHLF
jgi:hypothetical protein